MEKAKKTPEFWKKPRSIFSRQALPKKAKNEESGVKKANLTTLSGPKYRRLILHLPKDYQSRRPRAANLIPPFCGDKPGLSNCGDVSGDKPGLPQM